MKQHQEQFPWKKNSINIYSCKSNHFSWQNNIEELLQNYKMLQSSLFRIEQEFFPVLLNKDGWSQTSFSFVFPNLILRREVLVALATSTTKH